MSTTTGYINPVVVICPPNTSLSPAHLKGVKIYYVTTSGTATFPLNTPPGAFAAQATCLTAEVHKRGHSTLTAAKPQYSVHLHDKPATGHFLDMPHGGKHWVFNAPGMGGVDLTLVRNTMAFHAQRAMGQWAPRTKFFEMFLVENQPDQDGYDAAMLAMVEADPASYYQGVYCNMEKIRQEKHRIDTPVYAADTMPVGAFVMQLNPSSDKYAPMEAYAPLPLTADVQLYEPKNDYFTDNSGANAAQLTEIQTWYNNGQGKGWGARFATIFDNAGTQGFTPDWGPIRASTDYASFATYFLLNELARDPDGYHKSTFMYKTADTRSAPDTMIVRGQCFAGPLWDKNKSFGNPVLDYPQDYASPDGWLYSMLDGGQSPVWWHVLLQDSTFCQEVATQWAAFSTGDGVLTATYLNGYIHEQATYLATTGALARNNTKWAITDYDTQLGDLTSYITNRLTWMGDNMTALVGAPSP